MIKLGFLIRGIPRFLDANFTLKHELLLLVRNQSLVFVSCHFWIGQPNDQILVDEFIQWFKLNLPSVELYVQTDALMSVEKLRDFFDNQSFSQYQTRILSQYLSLSRSIDLSLPSVQNVDFCFFARSDTIFNGNVYLIASHLFESGRSACFGHVGFGFGFGDISFLLNSPSSSNLSNIDNYFCEYYSKDEAINAPEIPFASFIRSFILEKNIIFSPISMPQLLLRKKNKLMNSPLQQHESIHLPVFSHLRRPRVIRGIQYDKVLTVNLLERLFAYVDKYLYKYGLPSKILIALISFFVNYQARNVCRTINTNSAVYTEI